MSTTKWSNATVTSEGLSLQAELLNGGGIEFTRVMGADANGDDKIELTMQPTKLGTAKITIPVLLSNIELTEGFTMTQLRFYAKGTGGAPATEILYAVVQDEDGDQIPSASESPGFTADWSYTFQFGNAESMTVSLDPAGLISLSMVGQPNGVAALDANGQVAASQLIAMLQSASVALAYDDESTYEEGDYCTRDGQLYKANADIATAETWDASHWTAVNVMDLIAALTGEEIPTSASDPTSISSQLSNRLRIPVDISIGSDLDNIKSAGMYFCGAAQDVSNTSPNPNGETAFALMVEKTYALGVKQTLSWYYSGGAYYRTFDGSAWHDWIPLATATPPQEFGLPLAEGVSAVSSAYWKDQFGVVTGHFNVLASSSQTGSSPVIATLPEGFRPSRQANATAVVSSGESLGLLVLVTGEIQLQDAASVTLEGKYIKGLFSFVAAT